jgi:pimeloyl-ACP methyl ester carboxylesterase
VGGAAAATPRRTRSNARSKISRPSSRRPARLRVRHSSGAGLTLETAVRIGGIDRAALYEPPYIIDDSRASIPPEYPHRLAEMLAQGRRGDAVEYFLTVGVGLPKEAVAPMREGPSWQPLEELAHTLPYDIEIMSANVVDAQLPVEAWRSITVPVLVMDGEASPEWSRNSVLAVADALPAGTRRSLPGQTHQVDPGVLAPVLVEFFLG